MCHIILDIGIFVIKVSCFLDAGIAGVFSESNFITVTLTEDASWRSVNYEVFVAIYDFYDSGKPLLLDSNDTTKDNSETVAMIKELLETRIRPALQGDGGDIEYRGFNADTGVVKLKMRGACHEFLVADT